MNAKEEGTKTPLTIDALRSCIKRGLKGTEEFWQQFDVFRVFLGDFSFSPEKVHSVVIHVEFHVSPGESPPDLVEGELGDVMNRNVEKNINMVWPGLFDAWNTSTKNESGSEYNLFGNLSSSGNILQIPPDDEEVELFRYEKPESDLHKKFEQKKNYPHLPTVIVIQNIPIPKDPTLN